MLAPSKQNPPAISLGKKIIFSLILMLSMVLAFELLCRLMLPMPRYQPFPAEEKHLVAHETRGYAFVQNQQVQWGKKTVFFNELGFRDDPIGSKRNIDILAVGDSFTIGTGLDVEDSWPKQLQDLLNQDVKNGKTKRVLNAGVPGYSIRQIRIQTEELLFTEKLFPKTIIVGLYTSRYWRIQNPYVLHHGMVVMQSKIPSMKIIQNGYLTSSIQAPWMRQLDFWFAEHFQLGAYLLSLSVMTENYVLGMLNPTGTRRTEAKDASDLERMHEDKNVGMLKEKLHPLILEVTKLIHIAQQAEIPLYILLVNEQEKDGTFARHEKAYNQIIKEVGGQYGVSVIDPLPALEAKAAGMPIMRMEKDHHWSSLAHKIVAQELKNAL